MKRKRKPVKAGRRKPRSIRVSDGRKRELTYLHREITEEAARDIPWEYIKGVRE